MIGWHIHFPEPNYHGDAAWEALCLTHRAHTIRHGRADCPAVRVGLDRVAGTLELAAAQLLALDTAENEFMERADAAGLVGDDGYLKPRAAEILVQRRAA